MSNSVLNETKQYLTFKLSDEVFGVDVAQVREILDYIKITKVPQTPDFMCGVINLRGSVVPVVDMNLKFGMNLTERTVNTCIVVVEVKLGDETAVLGALVDSVQEVFEIEPQNIEPAPRIGTKLNTEFIKGMGKREEKFIILLDIDKVFSSEELEIVQSSGNFKSNEINSAK
ncbi:MAG: chemotaxis protein CheW [Bacteroidetes bacterium]|nr:chemotaxis protein CheW [Bacteroidota bacterium]MBU1115624.1 chemotaxis protein CheW [Bacteroidota bacterium]MBU1797604.1 chemotaxis protein CheW [Bacteroidota bacterium]